MLTSTIAQRFGVSDPVEHLSDLDLFAECTRAQLHKIDALTTDLRIPKDRILNIQFKAQNTLDGPDKMDWKLVLEALAKQIAAATMPPATLRRSYTEKR